MLPPALHQWHCAPSWVVSGLGGLTPAAISHLITCPNLLMHVWAPASVFATCTLLAETEHLLNPFSLNTRIAA
jgi:hypothetical protein